VYARKIPSKLTHISPSPAFAATQIKETINKNMKVSFHMMVVFSTDSRSEMIVQGMVGISWISLEILNELLAMGLHATVSVMKVSFSNGEESFTC
jgi:hypothetical protein